MRHSSLKSLLLVLLLVSGQWLNFAHAGKHPALSGGGEQNCEFCVHAQGLGAGLAEVPQVVVPSRAHEAPLALIFVSALADAPAHYPIRGPPLSLV